MIHERRVAALSGAIGLTITLILGVLAIYIFVGAVQSGLDRVGRCTCPGDAAEEPRCQCARH